MAAEQLLLVICLDKEVRIASTLTHNMSTHIYVLILSLSLFGSVSEVVAIPSSSCVPVPETSMDPLYHPLYDSECNSDNHSDRHRF